MNLEDFGIIGLMDQMIQLTRQGEGVAQLAEGTEKREQYGYWEARSKTAFISSSFVRSRQSASTTPAPPRRHFWMS